MLIKEKELQQIQAQFNQVIQYNYPIKEINTDGLFQEWYENKEVFISTFGGLIYEFPTEVQFNMCAAQKEDKFKDVCTKLYLLSFSSVLNDNPVNVYKNLDINPALYQWFIESVTADSFFENRTAKEFQCNNGNKIPSGAKVLKSFKYFIKNEKLLRELQDECSIIIQENKLKGHICLSVHPLDFLSLSENACNWSTCHSLQKEFAAGNLSLMVDSSTFIVYLKSGHNQIISNFPEDILWNNKKWRMLGFLSQDFKMMFLGRQYPCEIQGILNDTLYDIFQKIGLIGKNWTPFINDCYKANEYFWTNQMYPRGYEQMEPLIKFLKLSLISLNFNDLLYSSDYKQPYWAAQYAQDVFLELDNEESSFEIGKPVKCLKCGKHYILDSEIMVCRDCYGVKQNVPLSILEKQMLKKEN